MICLKHCVLTVFAAIGANCRKAINRAGSGMSRNVTQLTEIASRLAESDHLDSLTGVENRNHFHDHLEQMLQREGGG
jgi:PleD family two-component response regulator